MKRIIASLFGIFIATNCFAGIISFSSTETATRAWINNALYTVYNTVNGDLDSDNLSAGAVTSNDIATSVNPLVRDNENIGEYIFSGLTIATSATLASTITAGVAYVEDDGTGTLHRVVTASTAKTFTASKDTWVYLSYTGAFYYNEQTIDATQPTTPDNYIIIAKVVTSGTAVTSVVDQRQTTPANLRIYEDYKQGIVLSRDVSDVDKISVDVGEIEFGTDNGKVRRNTTPVGINFATTGRGGLDTGSMSTGFYYVFAVADDDNASNFEGIASLSDSNASGVTGERLVGWCYANDANTISAESVGAYKGKGGDSPNIVSRYTRIPVTVSTAVINSTPPIKMFTSGRPVMVTYSVTGLEATGGVGAIYSISIDSAIVYESELEFMGAGEGQSINETWSKSFFYRPNRGEHTFQAKAVRNGANDFTQKIIDIIIEEK